MNRGLVLLKAPVTFIVMPRSSFSPQEGLLAPATPASVAASVSSPQPGKWFVLARAVCAELATYIISGHGRSQHTLGQILPRVSTCRTQAV